MSTALKQLERYKTSNSAPHLSLLIIILCSLMRGLSKEACAWTDISECFTSFSAGLSVEATQAVLP